MKTIILSTFDVRAILDGKKTQTRRTFKKQPVPWGDCDHSKGFYDIGGNNWVCRGCGYGMTENGKSFIVSRYQPGDILWVRETWQSFFPEEVTPNHQQGPRSFSGIPAESAKGHYMYFYYRADGEIKNALWCSPVSMPKKAARLFLLVKSVWLERLQDITAEDVFSEGIYLEPPMSLTGGQQLPKDWDKLSDLRRKEYFQNWARMDYIAMCYFVKLLFKEYGALWDSLNTKRGYPWESNPFCWKIKFKVLEDKESA